jgi:hypothetical protein
MVNLFFALLLSFSARGVSYTLADLEVLVTEDNPVEFFQHARDIRPSERQEAWKTMVVKMGDSLSQVIKNRPQITKKDFQTIEELFTWSALRADDVFKTRRQEIGLRYLRVCLKSEKPCWEDLKSFWEKNKEDADTAMKLAELTLNLPHSPLTTWTFLDVALKSPLSEFYCKKDFVMNALWGKIEIDYVKLGPQGDLMKKIDETVHPDCVPSLVETARKRLYQPPKVFDRELSFQVLRSQLKANEAVTDFFYSVYLLDNPSQGELFNYSWNRVKELGKTVERRERVLETLKKLDPLPDAILSTLDETKKRVVLGHFKTYFPEYFDFYANQCLSFYGGKEKFPNGNPTIHCQNLMSSELGTQILDDTQIKKFQEIRNI